jgi:adenylosuccinate lyase
LTTVDELIEGYGPGFPSLEELFGVEATEADELRLSAPTAEMGRYLNSVAFMCNVTSGGAVSLGSFHVGKEYFIALSEELETYKGPHRKIIGTLTDSDKEAIRGLCISLDDVIQAEKVERFSDHDTAARMDLLKLKIATELPHLGEYVEGVHFAVTSEDNMGNVFGMVANTLVYGHVVPKIIEFCEIVFTYVHTHEEHGPQIMPALTHRQAAEPTTLGKKLTTIVAAVDEALEGMMRKDEFMSFAGKMGGAIGNLTTHYLAYPDHDWQDFAERFVEGLGLHYDPMTNQAVTYMREARLFTSLGNVCTALLKYANDFTDWASAPGQFLVKRKKAGEKASSIMPNKSNTWRTEGAKKMLLESREMLFHYAKELPNYPHEGDMGRSSMYRNLGKVFMPLLIAIERMGNELQQYHPSQQKIEAFFSEYPGMCGSVVQTNLKRDGVPGDPYRVLQGIALNPDGTCADNEQFYDGLQNAMDRLQLDDHLRDELGALTDPHELIGPAHRLATEALTIMPHRLKEYSDLCAVRVLAGGFV